MKYRISAVLILSLMLSMLILPLAVMADDSKSIIKGMVQAPEDYSVGVDPWEFGIDHLWTKYFLGYYPAYDRVWDYPDWVFWRLPEPG